MRERERVLYVEFVSARYASLYRTAYLLTGNHHTAEDLVQTVLTKVYVSWGRVRRAERPESYARRMLANEAVSLHRHRWTTEVSTARPAALAHAGSHGWTRAVRDRHADGVAGPCPADTQATSRRGAALLRGPERGEGAPAVLQIAPGTVESHAFAALLALSTHLPDGPDGSAPCAGADMNLEADVRAALAEHPSGTCRPGARTTTTCSPEGGRLRRRRAAGRLGGVAAVLSVVLAATSLDRSGPRCASDAHRPPARDRSGTCHRPSRTSDRHCRTPRQRTRIPRPRAPTSAPSPRCEPAPCTSRCPAPQIVWRSHQGRTKVIGQLGEDAVEPAPKGWFWGRTRAVVGHPSHDLVAWVERVGPRAGQVVVVEASTGDRLATTKLEHPLPRPVIITSIDEHVVHFAAPDVEDGPSVNAVDVFEPRGDQFWTWPWADNEAPHTSREPDEGVADVSGDVWAIGDGAFIRFEDTSGQSMSTDSRLVRRPDLHGLRTQPGRAVLVRPGLRGGRQHPHRRDARAREPSLAGTAGSCHPGGPGAHVLGLGPGPTTMAFGLSGGNWIDCDAETGSCTPPSATCSFVHCDVGLLPTN